MTTAAVEAGGRAPTTALQSAGGGDAAPEGSGRTLEEVVLGAWEELCARGEACCPVCRGTLGAAGCGSCGASLS